MHYLLDQTCHASRRTYGRPGRDTALTGSALQSAYDPFKLPGPRIWQRLKDKPRNEVVAFCSSANVRLADGSAQLQPSASEGFVETEFHDKHYWT